MLLCIDTRLERKSVIVMRVGVLLGYFCTYRYKFIRSLLLEVLRLLFQHPTPIRLALASSLLPDISWCLHPNHRFIPHAIRLPLRNWSTSWFYIQMSDSFTDLWRSSTPSNHISSQTLGATKPQSSIPKRRQDAFSILSASQPASRTQSPKVASTTTQSRNAAPPGVPRNDAFDDLFSGSLADRRNHATTNMTIAERAAAAQKAKYGLTTRSARLWHLHGPVLILLHSHRRLVLLHLVQHRTTSISLRLPHLQHLPQNHP